MRAKQGECKRLYSNPPCGDGLLVVSLVVSTVSSRLGSARVLMVGEDVGDADVDALDSTTLRTVRGSHHGEKNLPNDVRKDYTQENLEVGEEVYRRSLHKKFPNRYASKIIR